MSTIKILGIDPSLANTGWCVLEVDTAQRSIERVVSMGTILTKKSKNKKLRKSSDDLERARIIANALQGIIEENQIRLAASEIPSGAQSASASRAFGIVVGLLASLSVPIIEVTPREVKLATTGSPVADKEDMVRWAVEVTKGHDVQWNTSKSPNEWGIEWQGAYVTKTMEHQADAIATGHTAVTSEQFRQLAGFLASVLQ